MNWLALLQQWLLHIAATLMFDKAEVAVRLNTLRAKRSELTAELAALAPEDEAERARETH